MGRVVSQVDTACCWFIWFNRHCLLNISFGIFAKFCNGGLLTFSNIILVLLYLPLVLLTACSFLLNNLLTWFVRFEIQYLQALKILGYPNHHILQVMREDNFRLDWCIYHLWSFLLRKFVKIKSSIFSSWWDIFGLVLMMYVNLFLYPLTKQLYAAWCSILAMSHSVFNLSKQVFTFCVT